MNRLILVYLLVCAAQSARSQGDFKISEMFPIEASHSYMGFSVKYMGYAMVRGRFPVFQGAVRYNEKDLTKTSVSLSIDVGSLDTDNDWRDKDLKSANWFNADVYPKIEFVSQKVEVAGQGLQVTGNLTIHGTTRLVTIPLAMPSGVLKDARADDQVVFTAAWTLNRTDYGVEGKNWSAVKEGVTGVANEVNLEITILAKQIREKNFRNWVSDAESPEGKIYNAAKAGGADAGLKVFESLKADPSSKVSEVSLRNAGLMLLKEGQAKDAAVLFQKNLEAYPQVAIAYNDYGNCLATMENWSEARKYYLLALEKDPSLVGTKEILRHIK